MLRWILISILAASCTQAFPFLDRRATVSTLSTAQIAEFKPFTFYAKASGCSAAKTLAWNCGEACNAHPDFKPVASGGDGNLVQFWYVGYDPKLQSVIVGYQGTDFSKLFPILTDADFKLDELDAGLFPGISTSIKTHDGFGNAQARSAKDVLKAVQTAMSTHQATSVTIVGHSLGAALALITSVYLPLHLPATTTFKTVTYAMPRVGNQEFANYVDSHVHLTHINNKKDVVPILPGRFMDFKHPAGEIHIDKSGNWVNCPGQDNTDKQCTVGSVRNVLLSDPGDHMGPYDGVMMGC